MKFLFIILLAFSACSKEKKEDVSGTDSLSEIEVNVLNEKNVPLEKVDVLLVPERVESERTLSGETNSKGLILFSDLEPGKYQVKIKESPWVPSSKDVFLNAGEVEKVSIRLSTPFRKLKIISYNIKDGLDNNDSKKDDFVKWVMEKNPDILCYQELNGFSKKSLEEFASRFGHGYTQILKEKGYPVGVSSKFPITNVQRIFDQMVHGALSVKIKDLNVVVVHLSPTTLESRITEMNKLTEFEETLDGDFTIFAGDFNSYSELDKIAYGPDFEEDMLERISNVPVDFTVTDMLKEKGYEEAHFLFSDVFKRTLPTDKYREPGKPGARYDYIFLSHSLKEFTVSTEIIHDENTHYLSDHYPVMIQLDR